jgi:hypothetical protein
MTENDYKTAVELLACCESWEAAVCVMGNVRAGDVAKLLKTILATTQQPSAQCTCPSGDGSLRWPCPVHPPESVPEELRAAINHMLDSDGSRGRYSAVQCGEAHDEIERLLTSSQPAASRVVTVDTERAERAAKAVVQWLYEGMDGATVNIMVINVEAIILSVLRGEE